MLDSNFKTDKSYYPQVFLKECQYVIKEKKSHNYITDDVEISSDSDEEILEKIQMEKNSDYEKNYDEKILEKIQIKKNYNEEGSSEEDSAKENQILFYIKEIIYHVKSTI